MTDLGTLKLEVMLGTQADLGAGEADVQPATVSTVTAINAPLGWELGAVGNGKRYVRFCDTGIEAQVATSKRIDLKRERKASSRTKIAPR